jgi:hypothetical protein
MLYEGAPTLKITTRNFREGVRFDLKAPLDIEPYREAGYLRLRLHFQDAAVAAPVGMTPGAPGGLGLPGGPGIPGMPGGVGLPGGAIPQPVAPGGFGGDTGFNNVFQLGPLPPLGNMGGLPAAGTEQVVTGPTPQETALTELLCTFILDNGIMEGTIEIPKQWDKPELIDFDKVRPDAKGWLLFPLPIKQMRSTPGASGQLRRIILSGDREDTFFLTQAALVVESGDMSVSIRRFSDPPGTQNAEITVKPGVLTLVAEVEAGAADPAIEWNFDADNVGNLPVINLDGTPAAPAGGELPGAAPVGRLPGAILPGGLPAAGQPEPPIGNGEADAPVAGPRIDARGLVAKFTYPNEEQNYRVEVTIRDRSGKKEPVTSSVLVRVRG